jgi:hypothetical protein
MGFWAVLKTWNILLESSRETSNKAVQSFGWLWYSSCLNRLRSFTGNNSTVRTSYIQTGRGAVQFSSMLHRYHWSYSSPLLRIQRQRRKKTLMTIATNLFKTPSSSPVVLRVRDRWSQIKPDYISSMICQNSAPKFSVRVRDQKHEFTHGSTVK